MAQCRRGRRPLRGWTVKSGRADGQRPSLRDETGGGAAERTQCEREGKDPSTAALPPLRMTWGETWVRIRPGWVMDADSTAADQWSALRECWGRWRGFAGDPFRQPPCVRRRLPHPRPPVGEARARCGGALRLTESQGHGTIHSEETRIREDRKRQRAFEKAERI